VLTQHHVDQGAITIDGAVEVLPMAVHPNIRVSRPKEFHLRPLSEPDVNLSAHPAPITQPKTHIQATSV
jgi:hypothetical protein